MSAETLDILCLEPWMGGSHADFLEGWASRSKHRVELLGLAPRHWRWRMRSAPWEFARRIARKPRARPDVLFVSDYVDLPALLGSLPADWAGVPTVAYFHENQLTYPEAPGVERDGHLCWTNIATCVRADRVVFNSRFHADEFRAAGVEFLATLPRPSPRAELAAALDRAAVIPPGIDWAGIPLGTGGSGPLRVLFPHRWEHDKRPREFLVTTRELVASGAPLELVLLGERGHRVPEDRAALLSELAPVIAHDGFAESRAEYLALVGSCDLVVSMATHEFYGIAVVEALAAGCAPLLPDRLAYPEILPDSWHAQGLYADEQFSDRLRALASNPGSLRTPAARRSLREAMRVHDRAATGTQLDGLAEELAAVPHKDSPTP